MLLAGSSGLVDQGGVSVGETRDEPQPSDLGYGMPAAATYPPLIGKSFVAPLSSDPGVFSERSRYNVDDMPGIRSASSVGPALSGWVSTHQVGLHFDMPSHTSVTGDHVGPTFVPSGSFFINEEVAGVFLRSLAAMTQWPLNSLEALKRGLIEPN
ncbi:hypothetical protein B0H14DRAFT_3527767 [Mycena olivaceomarginata]|nr:hypothetical protein B0H14DRAFT_3527767 [Mycena olivaceomarginata]